MYEYFVVLRRQYQCYNDDYVTIHDREEAIECKWIDKDGNRVWAVPIAEEKMPTFVWGFKTLEEADVFYEAMTKNEVGVKVTTRTF